jgi:hypothetical protein
MRQLLTTGTRGNPRVENLEVDNIAYLSQVIESVNVLGSAISSATTINVSSGSMYYYSTDAAANWTINITDTTNLNTTLDAGQAITIVTLVTQGGTAYYNTAITVDGASTTVTWLDGAAPTQGTVSGIDVYSYTVIKIGNNTFRVLASVNNYA